MFATGRASFVTTGGEGPAIGRGRFGRGRFGFRSQTSCRMREPAVSSMRERLRRGGTVAAYVWDYAGGMEFLRFFWDEAATLDPRAVALDEGRRFPLCREESLGLLFRAAGLAQVETDALEIATDFATFDDYWTPLLRGTGPAPSYVASLEPAGRESLRERLRRRLPVGSDGRIRLHARAWAARAVAA